MDCTRARRDMHAWLDGELPPDKARRMVAHVSGCDSCAALARELTDLFDALEELPGLGPDPELVRDTVRAAADIQVPTFRWWAGLPALYKGAGFAAVAAGLLLGIVLYNVSPFAPDKTGILASPAVSSVLLVANDMEYL